MFFSQNEAVAFVQLLVFIANADGEITAEEASFLDDYCDKSGIAWRDFDTRTIDEILSVFSTFNSKIEVLQELVKLAMVDGVYSKEERAGVIEIAKKLSVPDVKVYAVEDWVQRGLAWIAEGQAMRNEVTE